MARARSWNCLPQSLVFLLAGSVVACGGGDDNVSPHGATGAGGAGGATTGTNAGGGVTTSGANGGGGGATSTTGSAGAGGQGCLDAEVCGDGLDNDCNGQVDDGCRCSAGETQSCYSGPRNTEGVGACKAGTQSCGQDGMFGPCTGDVVPAGESCNGKDDDCNGTIDDVAPLTCGIGQCANTVPGCLNGAPNSCTPKAPSPEVCDGVDNDCDGSVDEGDPGGGAPCSTGMPGVCGPGIQHCQSGIVTCVQNAGSSAEVCDGLDNDCDGTVDDGNPGGGGNCNTGLLGVCSAGKLLCQNGVFVCQIVNSPSAEKCDGIDNDCDGVVDDGNPGGGGACSTGLLGACSIGTYNCQGGVLVCTPSFQPTTEVCDGIDNDCDGVVDEGNPGGGAFCGTGLPGVCFAGTTNCAAGQLICTQNTQATAETCDGLDNDCDGVIDDGNPGGGAACTTGLQGVCSAGTLQCQSGFIQCVQNQFPSPEICNDGIDQDCDGLNDDIQIVYLSENFANNNAGWQLGTEWAIGALPGVSSCGDPAFDATPTADNGVAGVVIGGCSTSSVSKLLHSYYYLTSPPVNTASAPSVFLKFNRWLNSDYTPYMNSVIEVFNGVSWVTIWQNGGSGVADMAWQPLSYDITAYKNSQMRVRWGFNIANAAVYSEGQWNIDDVQIVTGSCQ